MSTRTWQQFLWKHRGKIAVAATAVVATGLLVGYTTGTSSSNDDSTELEKKKEKEGNDSNENLKHKLIRIRGQLENSSAQILPSLRLKINEEIDVLQAIRQIKTIRMNKTHSPEEENQLWEEIKILSFTLWFSSIYLTCVTCALLRVQLFLLSKYENGSISLEGLNSLIEKTYGTLLEKGVKQLTEIIKDYIQRELLHWTVKENTAIQYEEFHGIVMNLRHFIEQEYQDLIPSLVIPNENEIEQQISTRIHDSTHISMNKLDPFYTYFAELWDIVESPMFHIAFLESCDTCFRLHMDQLRQDIFTPLTVISSPSTHSNISHNSSSNITTTTTTTTTNVMNNTRVGEYSSPPLATLLPQLKALASRILPMEGTSYEVKEILNGSGLEALCLSIYNITPITSPSIPVNN